MSHDRAFLERATSHTLDASGGGGALYAGGYSTYLLARRRRREALEERDDDDAAAAEPTPNVKKSPSRFRLQSPTTARGKSAAAAEVTASSEAPLPLLELTGAAVRAAGAARRAEAAADVASAGSTIGTSGSTDPDSAEAPLLRGVSLTLRRGECALVVGPNGAGKTSLLEAAAGEAHALAGGGWRMADNVNAFHFRQEAADRLDGPRTAAEALLEACGGEAAGVSDERRYRVMKQLGLPPAVQHTPLSGLSGGERARLCVAQMLLSGATLLICDEPTNHLDLQACPPSYSIRPAIGCECDQPTISTCMHPASSRALPMTTPPPSPPLTRV